jgi:hypothetical protein
MKKNTYSKEELIDRKVLFAYIPSGRFAIQEGKINEFSPAGDCVKINNDWYLLEKIQFLELFTKSERPTMRF